MTGGNRKKEKSSGHDQEGRGAKKPFRMWKPCKGKSQTYEANSIALPKPWWQKTTTSNDSIRKRKNSNKPTIKTNGGCAKSGVFCARKEYSIVGPMQKGEGS